MLDHLLQWILTGVKFGLFLHFYACGWLLIHHFKVGNN